MSEVFVNSITGEEQKLHDEFMKQNSYMFSLGFEEWKKFNEIKNAIKVLHDKVCDTEFEFRFTPSAIGTIVEIYSITLDKVFNITDYDRW